MLLQNSIKYLLLMLLLIFFQVAVFNNINFWGYANPYFYIIFILLFPLNTNRYLTLLLAFILGLSIDFLENTGGVNAFATVFIAYIRHYFVALLTTNTAYDSDGPRLYNLSITQWIIYLAVMIFMHHFLVDFLESFKFSMSGDIALKSLLGTFLTFILTVVYLLFFPVAGRSEY